jgi:hypothetical protein
LVGALLAYLALALPLPFVLLDHELGLLTGDPTHSADDDHAWLDHAAGDGMASGDAGPGSLGLVVLSVPLFETCHQLFDRAVPSVRGPPPISHNQL